MKISIFTLFNINLKCASDYWLYASRIPWSIAYLLLYTWSHHKNEKGRNQYQGSEKPD